MALLCVKRGYLRKLNNFISTSISIPVSSKAENSHEGGVGLLVRRGMYTEIVDELTVMDSIIESLFVKLRYRYSHLVVASIYTPPRENLSAFIDKLKKCCYITE